MSPKTGRPISAGGRKDKLLQIRLDTESLKTLDQCAETLDMTRSGAVREGIRLLSEHLGEKK